MQIDQGALIGAGVALLLAGGGWIFSSIVWAKGQSGRIDLVNSRIDRLGDRVTGCENKANEQGEQWRRVDDRMQRMDSKLNRLMGRLGVPTRADDIEEVL
jgi:hypothetical protein